MSGLVLKLHPYERVLVNGAVVENGPKRSKVSILTPNANILRLRDAMRPDEVTTPIRRVCYIAQLVLSGDVDEGHGNFQLIQGLQQLKEALAGTKWYANLEMASQALEQGDHYRVLKSLRSLFEVETVLMNGAAT